MVNKSAPVTFQLVGGLGNQLFGFFAGKYLAGHTNLSVRYDLSQLDKGFTSHGSSIRSFALPDAFGLFSSSALASSMPMRAIGLLARRFQPLLSLHRRVSKEFTSQVLGFDPSLTSVHAGDFVRGYFQSWKYVQPIVTSPGFELSLRQPSDWYLHMEEAVRVEMPVVLHVRRGDYEKLADEFGLLAADYYAMALAKITELTGATTSVWVFSDEIAKARLELESFLPSTTRWIEPPSGADAAESLKLMSLARANVISNSTFSWWSAMLNPAGMVVAPAKWFKGKADPEDLYPDSWVLMPSIWRS